MIMILVTLTMWINSRMLLTQNSDDKNYDSDRSRLMFKLDKKSIWLPGHCWSLLVISGHCWSMKDLISDHTATPDGQE